MERAELIEHARSAVFVWIGLVAVWVYLSRGAGGDGK